MFCTGVLSLCDLRFGQWPLAGRLSLDAESSENSYFLERLAEAVYSVQPLALVAHGGGGVLVTNLRESQGKRRPWEGSVLSCNRLPITPDYRNWGMHTEWRHVSLSKCIGGCIKRD